MHAGVDGWGRPFDVVAGVRQLRGRCPLLLEEAWTSEAEEPSPATDKPSRSPPHSDTKVVNCTLAQGRAALASRRSHEMPCTSPPTWAFFFAPACGRCTSDTSGQLHPKELGSHPI